MKFLATKNKKKMRKIKKEHDSTLPGALRIADCTAISRGKENISDRIFKGEFTKNGEKRFEVREILLSLYHDKCAYCESKEFKPEVEHYRPKGGVTGVDHKGYYWLAYEWTNLIPSCHDCNTNGGKHNKFPIIDEAERVKAPPFDSDEKLDMAKCRAEDPPLIDENPYLLHPEIDEPKEFFIFNNRGEISGADLNGRGQKTWQICNMNRKNLIYRRCKLINECVREPLNYALSLFFEGEISENGLKKIFKHVFEKLKKMQAPENEYSLLNWYTFNNFDEMIASLFESAKMQKAVSNAFKNFVKGKL